MYGGRVVEAGPVARGVHPAAAPLHPGPARRLRPRRRRRARPAAPRSPAPCPAAGRFPAGCVFRNRCHARHRAVRADPGVDRAATRADPASPATTRAGRRGRTEPARWRSREPSTEPCSALHRASATLTRDYRRPRTSLLRAGPGRARPARRELRRRARASGSASWASPAAASRPCCGSSPGSTGPRPGSVERRRHRHHRAPERRLRFLRERLQLVFQDPMSSLDPRMRVARHHRRAARRTGPSGAPASASAELLEAVGLPRRGGATGTRTSSPAASGSASRSPAPSPPARGILVADEPVSALDVSVRAQVLNLIADLVDELDADPGVRLPRPVRGPARLRPGRGHARRPDRRDRPHRRGLREPPAPLHPAAGRGRAHPGQGPRRASAPPTWPPPPSPGRTDRDEHQPHRRRPQRGRGGGRRLHPGAGPRPQRQRPGRGGGEAPAAELVRRADARLGLGAARSWRSRPAGPTSWRWSTAAAVPGRR